MDPPYLVRELDETGRRWCRRRDDRVGEMTIGAAEAEGAVIHPDRSLKNKF